MAGGDLSSAALLPNSSLRPPQNLPRDRCVLFYTRVTVLPLEYLDDCTLTIAALSVEFEFALVGGLK